MLRKKKITFISLALLLIIGGFFAWWQISQNNEITGEDSFRPKAEVHEQTQTQDDEKLTPPPVTPTANLTIDNLTAGQTVTNGTVVKGRVKSNDGIMRILLKGSSTGKISDYTIKIARSSSPQPYSFEVYFERPPNKNEKGILDLYTVEDGIRGYSKQIEVIFN